MIITATVIRVNSGSLLVRDVSNGMEILVFFRDTRRFSPGNLVRITYNGQMTHSIPPQITATSIQRIQGSTQPPQSTPSETRATVLQRRRNALLVRDMSNNRQLLVHFSNAHHFCVGQRITIRHDTIRMNNPPEVNAIDIAPIC